VLLLLLLLLEMDGAPWAGIGWDLSRSKPKTSFKNPFEDASVAGAVAVRQ